MSYEINEAILKDMLKYSKLARQMKLILPAIIFSLLLLIFAWPSLKFLLSASAPEHLTSPVSEDIILSPNFTGCTKKGEPYHIQANRAFLSENKLAHLEQPKAQLEQKNGKVFSLKANEGIFNQQENNLLLLKNVVLIYKEGYEFYTNTTNIDFKKGRVAGNQPIEGSSSLGNIKAKTYSIDEDGEIITFTGNVHLSIDPTGVKRDALSRKD